MLARFVGTSSALVFVGSLGTHIATYWNKVPGSWADYLLPLNLLSLVAASLAIRHGEPNNHRRPWCVWTRFRSLNLSLQVLTLAMMVYCMLALALVPGYELGERLVASDNRFYLEHNGIKVRELNQPEFEFREASEWRRHTAQWMLGSFFGTLLCLAGGSIVNGDRELVKRHVPNETFAT